VASGLAFVERQEDWISRERQRMAEKSAGWTLETELLWRGSRVKVRELAAADAALNGVIFEDGASLRAEVEDRLRAVAAAELPPRCLEFARRHDVAVSKVSVRSQRSRWGACSSRGSITLNWRLLQMPREVCDYVILHELMHRRQPNHSRKFWREVASVCPEWQQAERWLRKNGRTIL
jgi:predicted metal-dependent hydrolase